MQRLFHFALLSLGLVLATGCSSPAQRLESSITSQFKTGTTTRADVEQALGKPRTAMTGSNRRTAVIYHYGRYKPAARLSSRSLQPAPAGSVLLRSFSILYDPRGVVEKTSQHEATVNCHRDMLGLWLGNPLDEKDLARIQKGRTSARELAEYFGPPMGRAFAVDGRTTLFWFYHRIQDRFATRKTYQELKVIINEDGLVVDYVTEGNLQPTTGSR